MTTPSTPSKGAPWRVPESLSACRRELAQVEAQLSSVRAELVSLKARVEHAAIEAAGGPKALGANADDRERALRLALDDDAAYGQAVLEEAIAYRRLLALKAAAQIHEDLRRGDELSARERLIDVLERLTPGGALEDAALEAAITAARTREKVLVLPRRMREDGGTD